MHLIPILVFIIALICVFMIVRRRAFRAKGQMDPWRKGIYATLVALGAVLIYVAITAKL